MNYKFKTGEYIRYSGSGVCLIEDICQMDILGDGNIKEFYILKPNARMASTIYVPVDNDILTSRMEEVISKEEIDTLIGCMSKHSIEWIDDKKQRTDTFKSIIKRCDRQELLYLVRCLHERRECLINTGKNLSSGDETFLKNAEDIIANEFSFVLSIDCDKVSDYIIERINK